MVYRLRREKQQNVECHVIGAKILKGRALDFSFLIFYHLVLIKKIGGTK
jgi:hypothetical protein